MWPPWPGTGNQSPNPEPNSGQSEADCLRQDGIVVFEAGDLQSISLFKTPDKSDPSSLEGTEAHKSAVRRKMKYWSGGDDSNPSPGAEAEAGFSELRQQIRNWDTTTSLTETRPSTPNGHKKDNGSQVSDLSFPAHRGSKRLTVTLEDPSVNGDGNRRHSNTGGKEAKLKRFRWRNLKL